MHEYKDNCVNTHLCRKPREMKKKSATAASSASSASASSASSASASSASASSASASSASASSKGKTKMPMGVPIVKNTRYIEEVLHFTLSNVDVSIANGLRRTILRDIHTLAMRGFPHAKSTIQFTKNTTQLNNEILKTRLSCVPVHTERLKMTADEIAQNLEIRVNYKNRTDKMIYLTSENFDVFHKGNNALLDKSLVREMFPPDEKTQMFIDIVRMHPSHVGEPSRPNLSMSNSDTGDEVEFRAGLVVVTAATSSTFNVASVCSYSYTPDETQLKRAWNFEEKKFGSKEAAEIERSDWMVINRQRHYVANSFDFRIKSIGVYSNENLVVKACEILAENVANTVKYLAENTSKIALSAHISSNCYDVTFPDSHTVGKILERELYNLYFDPDTESNSTLTFCAFLKSHPQAPESVIRLAFVEAKDQAFILTCFDTASKNSVKRIINAMRYFTTASASSSTARA